MYKKFIFIIIVFLVLGCSEETNRSDISNTIVTKDRLGFYEEGTFYGLGSNIDTFIKSFGPSEKTTEYGDDGTYLGNKTVYQYINDGIEIVADHDDNISGITIYLITTETYKESSFSTDTGIRKGASLREIVKTHGEPYKKREHRISPYIHLIYKYGNDALQFSFKDGELRSIGLDANYIKWLN